MTWAGRGSYLMKYEHLLCFQKGEIVAVEQPSSVFYT